MVMESFLEWLKEFAKPEIIWFIVGLLLVIAEFAIPGLIVIYFGFGAIMTAILCIPFDFSLNTQIILFVIFSLAALLLTRRYLKKVFTGTNRTTRNDIDTENEYIGHKAIVIEPIDAGGEGRIEFQGSHWKATSKEFIEEGCRVVIVGHENLTMKVKRQ
jgi:membrane protein implicated in regulation of membrane protease activity